MCTLVVGLVTFVEREMNGEILSMLMFAVIADIVIFVIAFGLFSIASGG